MTAQALNCAHWHVMDIVNGQLWQAPWPQCWRGISQWLEGDVWCLIMDPEPARQHDGTCSMTHAMKFNGEWKRLVTQAELCEYLNRLHWSKVSECLLGRIGGSAQRLHASSGRPRTSS